VARLAGDGMVAWEVHAWHAVVRCGTPPPQAVARLDRLSTTVAGPFPIAAAAHAKAVTAGDPAAMLAAADRYGRLGMHLYAAEAAAQAYMMTRRNGPVPQTLVSRLADLVERCDAVCTPALMLPMPSLTARELEIAELAAAGLTSPQIAERLFLSPRTPDSHLRGIYTKLGITGRSQLASMLRLRRILSDRRTARV
jgi:DNA-binding CsgD family transcriptional regulator